MSDTKRRFVVVEDHDGDGMFCLGIFDDYRTALGTAIDSVWEFKQNYLHDGDSFHYTEMENMEGDGGEFMEVTFKSHCWEKELKHYYYILFDEEDEA